MRVAARYLLYLLFVAGAAAFWLFVAVAWLGLIPGDPECVIYDTPCPEPGLLERIGRPITILLSIPLTAFFFLFYRRLVRRLLRQGEGDPTR